MGGNREIMPLRSSRFLVIPAKVGIQKKDWMPAYAGMTHKNMT